MGFAASSARLLGLISHKSDLELQAQQLSHHRIYLASQVTTLFAQQSKLDPMSATARYLESRIQRLQMADKELEMRLNMVQSARDAAKAEMGTVRRFIKENIQDSFGLGQGR